MRLTSTLTLAALLLSAQTAASALSPALSAEARAADFTGKIKRVRIKGRKVGQYRTVVKTSTEGAVPAGVQVTLDGLDEGSPAGVTLTSRAPSSAAMLTEGTLDLIFPEDEGSITLSITLLDDLGLPLQEAVEVTLDVNSEALLSEAEFDLTDGTGVVTLREPTMEVEGDDELAEQGIIEIDLSSEDCSSCSLTTVAVEVLASEGFEVIEGTAELALSAADVVWKLDTEADLGDGRYQVLAEVLDDEETPVISAYAFRSTLDEDGLPGALTYARLSETRTDSRYAVTAWAAYTETPEAMTATITSSEGEDIASGEMTVKEAQRIASFSGLTFGDDPTGFTYSLAVDFMDAEGARSHTQSMEVPASSPGEIDIIAYDGERVEGDNLVAMALFSEDGEEWTVRVWSDHVPGSVIGEIAIDSIFTPILFEEPFEGPEPDELEVTPELDLLYMRTRATFTTTADPTFLVSISVASDLGSDNETVDFWATAGVSGFGSGTRKSTKTTAQQMPQLQ